MTAYLKHAYIRSKKLWERQQSWTIAHMNTADTLVKSGQWPIDNPIPSENNWAPY